MIRRLAAALLVMIAVAGCTGAPPPMPSPQATMPARCGLGDGIQLAFAAQTRFDDVWDGGLPPGEGARVGHAYVSADPIERDHELARVLCFLTDVSLFVGRVPDDWEPPQ